MLKACKYCGRIHAKDFDCGRRPVRTRYARSDTEKIRYTSAMNHKSAEIKERQRYLCPICLLTGDMRKKRMETHHIRKLRLRPDLLLDDSNLIALCEEHHKMADRGEIDENTLEELARERDQGIPPRVGSPVFPFGE